MGEKGSRWSFAVLKSGGRWELPRETPGVYVIKTLGGLFYVGSSVRMQEYRFQQFHVRWMDKEGIEWVKWKRSMKDGDWLMDEYRLIKRLQRTGRLLNLHHVIRPLQAITSTVVNNKKEQVKMKLEKLSRKEESHNEFLRQVLEKADKTKPAVQKVMRELGLL